MQRLQTHPAPARSRLLLKGFLLRAYLCKEDTPHLGDRRPRCYLILPWCYP